MSATQRAQAKPENGGQVVAVEKNDPARRLSRAKQPNAKERQFLEAVWMGSTKKDAFLEVWPETPDERASDLGYRLTRKDECSSYYQELVEQSDRTVGLTKNQLLRKYEQVFESDSSSLQDRIRAGQETCKLKSFYEPEKQQQGTIQVIIGGNTDD